jgi:hypothetical protein
VCLRNQQKKKKKQQKVGQQRNKLIKMVPNIYLLENGLHARRGEGPQELFVWKCEQQAAAGGCQPQPARSLLLRLSQPNPSSNTTNQHVCATHTHTVGDTCATTLLPPFNNPESFFFFIASHPPKLALQCSTSQPLPCSNANLKLPS